MTRRTLVRLASLLALVLLPVPTAFGGHAGDAAADPEPQYLLLQIFTAGPGFTTESGKRSISKLPSREFLEGEAQGILDAIGELGNDHHKLGIMIGPLALDHSDAQLRTLVEWTFEIATLHGIAVGLHIDDSKFWLNRSDLWQDTDNVEWLDWNGTPNSGQFLNWGRPWRLAPQACFNSPAVVEEARRVAGEVIGPAIADQVTRLREKGLEDLFAGVIVGWETAIGRDFESGKDLGYCALANRGYSKSNEPRNRDDELEAVVREWIEVWSNSISNAGVPADRIYSHIAFISRKQHEEEHAGATSDPSYSQSVMYSPPAVAFGSSHRPAFSVYPEPRIIRDIYAELDANGNPPWGSAEGTNVDIHGGKPTIPDEGMESYLARMFNHGATMTNLFGWGIGDRGNPFRRATEGDEAIAAYRKFLQGESLSEKSLGDSRASRASGRSELQGRMRALQGRIDEYLKAGGDMNRIQSRVETLEDHLKKGRLEELEKELDQIEEIIGANVTSSFDRGGSKQFDVATLQRQMRALPDKIEVYKRGGGVMSRVAPRVERIERHLKAGELEKAFAELQELSPILESP